MPSDVLVTHPGKIGDLCWGLATVKHLAETQGPVDMIVSNYLKPIVPLLNSQSYIHKAASDPSWKIEFNAPVTPTTPPPNDYGFGYRMVVHLGLTEWPQPNLFVAHQRILGFSGLDPWKPWLRSQMGSEGKGTRIGLHFSDEFAECKAGLMAGIIKAFPNEKFLVLTHAEARIAKEWNFSTPGDVVTVYTGPSGLSDWLMTCKLLVTCKSFARVMARGLGIPVAVIEPSTPRHNPCFDAGENLKMERILNGFDLREACAMIEKML